MKWYFGDMAIEKRPGRASPFRVYWNNPFTKAREHLSFATMDEAKKYDSLIKHRLKYERESFRPIEENPLTGGTVRELVALYLSAAKMAEKNLKETLMHLKTIFEMFGKREASSLEKKDIVLYMQAQERAGIKTTTAYRRISILRTALGWANENGYLESNPFLGVKIPRGKNEKFAPPTLAEFEALMSVAPNHTQRALLLSVSLGVRVGESELLTLKWQDVDLERKVIRVWSAKKNLSRPYRDIPIREDLLKSFEAWKKEDLGLTPFPETIVHYRGKAVGSIKTTWNACKRRAGITRRLRPYDLRHAYATYALDGGADIKAVSENMGHSDASMVLRHYQHTKEETRRAAVESLPAFPGYVPKNVPKKCPQTKKDLQN